jgi:hypothetical protein
MTAVRTTTGIQLLLAAATGLTACQAGMTSAPPGGDDGQEITTIATGTQCGYTGTAPAARWLDTADAVQAAYRQMTRQSLGANAHPAPTTDFTRFGVLQVFMGQQSTGGFQLRLQHPLLEHTASSAALRIDWLTPPPGALTPQVITSPCLMLGVPRGTWHTITVIDQTGQVRAAADLR